MVCALYVLAPLLRCLPPVLPSYRANQSVVLSDLYSRLKVHLVRANATANPFQVAPILKFIEL